MWSPSTISTCWITPNSSAARTRAEWGAERGAGRPPPARAGGRREGHRLSTLRRHLPRIFQGKGEGEGKCPLRFLPGRFAVATGCFATFPSPFPHKPPPSDAGHNPHPVRAASRPSGPPSLRDAARGRDGPRKRRGKSPCGRNWDPPLKDPDSQGESTAPYCGPFPPRSLPSREDTGTV